MLVIATLRYDFMFLQDPQKHLFLRFSYPSSWDLTQTLRYHDMKC